MDFIDHTIAWCRGEIFEGKMIALFGITVISLAILFWRLGTTPFAKALFVPLLVLGMVCAVGSGYMLLSNQKRIPEYEKAYQEAPAEFIQAEKKRAEGFLRWYPITLTIASIVMVLGMGSFLFIGGTWGRTIGLTVLLMGLLVFFIDHFSEERAETYYQHILEFAN